MEKNNIHKINDKVKWNAISAYLMLFISWLFLFNKTNKNIDNDFVKLHTKSAMIIHLWFFITYIVFIIFSLFSWISIMWIWLNNIIADIIFISLLLILILWIYKAKQWLEFKIYKNISISKDMSILDIDWDWKISEKEKLTIILSFIPLIGYINFWKYKENKTIQETTRLNILFSLFIFFLYIFSYMNLVNIFSLIYIIFVVFIWINLFTRNELVHIKIPQYLSPECLYNNIWILLTYLKNYLSDKNFKEFHIVSKENKIQSQKQIIDDEKLLSRKKDLRISKTLIYIPLINLIFLFFKNTKYSFHIVNGLMITFLLAFTWMLGSFWYFNAKLHILSLIPILFWIGYINTRLSYRMPIIYDIYLLLSKIFSFLKIWTKKIKEKRNEENEINLKIKK